MTHSLSNNWSFYGYLSEEQEQTNYEQNIKLLGRFNTVEDFWRIFSHTNNLSVLKIGSSFQIFKNETRAMREDPEHKNGGSFLVRVAKPLTQYYWERLVLAMIGNQLPSTIIGATVSSKKTFDNISIWHTDMGFDITPREEFCLSFCNLMNLPFGIRIDYTTHESVINKSPENKKNASHYSIKEENGQKVIINLEVNEKLNN